MRLLAVVLAAGCGFGGDPLPPDKPADAAEPDAPAPLSPRKLVLDGRDLATTLTNMPVLVSLTATQIDYSKVANPATDLKFTSGNDVLPHEIEQWNPSGESVVWVRVPQLVAGTTDGSFLMHFGAGVGAPDPVAVWQPSQFEVVNHLQADIANAFPNSASASYGATAVNVTSANAQLGAGIRLEAGGDRRLTIANSGPLFSDWATFTLELWLRPDYASMDLVVGEPGVMDKGGGLSLGRVFKAGVAPSQSLKFQIDWTFPSDTIRVSSVIEPQSWSYLVYTYDGTNVQLYRNGVLAGTAPVTGGKNLAMSTAELFLGGAAPLTGLIDELRISQQPRTADWIAAQHRSMSRQLIQFTDP